MLTEAERIARADARRERRSRRYADLRSRGRDAWSEGCRRARQAIAVRRLFGLDRHTATWDAEHVGWDPWDWTREQIDARESHDDAVLSWIERERDAELAAWLATFDR